MDRTDVLYWIDIKGDSPKPSFNIFNPSSNTNKRFYLPSRVGTVVPVSGDADVVVLALEDGLYTLNVKTSVLASVLPMRKASEATRMNDGKCDPLGRFWVRPVCLLVASC